MLVSTSLLRLRAAVSEAVFRGTNSRQAAVYVALSVSVLRTVCKVPAGHRTCANFAVPCSQTGITGYKTPLWADNGPVAVSGS